MKKSPILKHWRALKYIILKPLIFRPKKIRKPLTQNMKISWDHQTWDTDQSEAIECFECESLKSYNQL